MWTPTTRRHSRTALGYASDLTDTDWVFYRPCSSGDGCRVTLAPSECGLSIPQTMIVRCFRTPAKGERRSRSLWRVVSSAPAGESMNEVYLSAVWAPEVLGKDRIDQRRWAYAVQAPFDMPADMPGLIGAKVQLDGAIFEVGGFVPRMPSSPILQGEAIELLVRSATDRST
jgi:hypothetical protein